MRRLLAAAAIGLVPLVASATDLSTVVTNVDVTIDSATGAADDEAHGVAIDSAGEIVVGGHLTGANDLDAYLAKYSPVTAAEVWSLTIDGGPVDDVSRVSSVDRIYDVAIDDLDEIVAAGTLSGSVADGYATGYFVGKFDVVGVEQWRSVSQDGGGSLVQAAHAAAIDPGDGGVVAAGWAYRIDTVAGRWIMRDYIGTTGFAVSLVGHDVGKEDFAPDQAWDVAVGSDSSIVVVGAIGIDGTDANNAHYDWHVRKYDDAWGLLWEYTWGGDLVGLHDVARSVAVDASGHVFVAGYINTGTDNGEGASYDWFVGKYDGATGAVLWEVVWDGGLDLSDQAYAIDVDANGDVLVAGSTHDGQDRLWRLAHLSGSDGAEIAAKTWGPSEGEIFALDERDGQIALAGWSSNGTDRDIRLVVLDEDRDGDGVGDHADGCPDDANKLEPMVCGCGMSEADSDGDSYIDCEDACPDLPEKWEDAGVCGCDEPDLDRDADGTEDCIDNCPDDPEKIELGICGCGLPDSDSDGDGVMGCDDACSNTPAGVPVDDHGCPVDDSTGPGTDTGAGGGGGSGGKGGGCDTSALGGSGLLALLALAAVRRRRR